LPVLLRLPWVKFLLIVASVTPRPTWIGLVPSRFPVGTVAPESVWLNTVSNSAVLALNPGVLTLARLSPITFSASEMVLRPLTPLNNAALSPILFSLTSFPVCRVSRSAASGLPRRGPARRGLDLALDRSQCISLLSLCLICVHDDGAVDVGEHIAVHLLAVEHRDDRPVLDAYHQRRSAHEHERVFRAL